MVKRRPQEGGSGVGETFRAVLLTFLEQRGEQWLLSLLDAALVALFAEAVRAVVERRAEEYLRSLLQKTFDALPASVGSRAARTVSPTPDPASCGRRLTISITSPNH